MKTGPREIPCWEGLSRPKNEVFEQGRVAGILHSDPGFRCNQGGSSNSQTLRFTSDDRTLRAPLRGGILPSTKTGFFRIRLGLV